MDITSTMEQTLQAGVTKVAKVSGDSSNTSGWRVEFWRPLDAALHLGTPKPSLGPVGPASAYNSRTFID